MTMLIVGLIIFVAVHLIPSRPALRSQIQDAISAKGYMAAFSLLSLLSIVLIIMGLRAAPFIDLYTPPDLGRSIAMLLMLPAIYLFFSNSVGPAPSSAQVFTAHPLNFGVIIWCIAHLIANGDLAHVLLFLTMGIFSVISTITGTARGAKPKRTKRPPFIQEAMFLGIVVVIYMVIVWAHPYFTGMPVVAG